MFDKDYFSKDIFDFLLVLKKHDVKFVVVGGEAVIYYGHARLTGDIDIFYQAKKNNIDRLWNALMEFWDNDIPMIKNKEEFEKDGIVVQFGLPPNRIDLLNNIEGVNFDEVWKNKVIESIDLGSNKSEKIYLIGINELIKNKKSSGRPKDLDDIKFLKQIENNCTK